jgi:hypothetical protein
MWVGNLREFGFVSSFVRFGWPLLGDSFYHQALNINPNRIEI